MHIIKSQPFLVPLILSLAVAGCGYRHEAAMKTDQSPNAQVLKEVNQAQAWFHAKKVRPIWTKQLDKDQSVKTLEGTEEVKAASFLCRGEAGDVWPQTTKSLEEKYQPAEKVDADGWRRYLPWPDNQGVPTAQVPAGDPERRAWLAAQCRAHLRPRADRFRGELVRAFGNQRGVAIEYVEAFEACGYGAPLDEAARQRLFGFLA